jgi:hypothetical protein
MLRTDGDSLILKRGLNDYVTLGKRAARVGFLYLDRSNVGAITAGRHRKAHSNADAADMRYLDMSHASTI